MHKKMEAILSRVQKPARYVGGEWGSVMKNKTEVDLRFAFCFPDTYEVGMSHLGSRILYVRARFCAMDRYGRGNAKGGYPAVWARKR